MNVLGIQYGSASEGDSDEEVPSTAAKRSSSRGRSGGSSRGLVAYHGSHDEESDSASEHEQDAPIPSPEETPLALAQNEASAVAESLQRLNESLAAAAARHPSADPAVNRSLLPLRPVGSCPPDVAEKIRKLAFHKVGWFHETVSQAACLPRLHGLCV